MRYYYVFFTEGIVSSVIDTHGELTEGMRVDENPEQYLYKTFNDGVWSQAPEKRVGMLNEGKLVYIYTTYFVSNLENNHVVLPENVDLEWTLNGETWQPPVVEELP